MKNNLISDTKDTVLVRILTSVVSSITIEAIMGIFKLVSSIGIAKIEISEWDSAFDNINKALYQIGKKQ